MVDINICDTVTSYLIEGIHISGFFLRIFGCRHPGNPERFFPAHIVHFNIPHDSPALVVVRPY